MKRIFIIALVLLAAFQSFGQTGNDSTKYVWYRYTYGNRLARYWADTVLNIPSDTAYSKYGVARKGTTLYVGNGAWWTGAGSVVTAGYGLTGTTTFKVDTSINGLATWKDTKRKIDSLAARITTYTNPMTTLGDIIYGASSGTQTRLAGNTATTPKALVQTGNGTISAVPVWTQTLVYTPSASPLPGNHLILDGAGTGATDALSTASVQDGIVGNGCQVSYSGSGLVFTISSPCSYYIGGVQYSIPTTNVTLAAADPSDPRQDAIVVTTTPSGTSVVGDAQTDPQVPTVNQTTQLFLTSVFVDAGATTPTQIGQTIVRDEGAGGEWTTAGSTMTINAAYATNPFHGSVSLRVTAAANNTFVQLAAPATVSKSNYNNLVLYIRNNSVLNAARGLGVTLLNGNTQVGNAISLVTYGYVKTLTGSYQTIAIPMSAFAGADAFNRIRINGTGTGGTVDWQVDYIQLQSGVTAPAAPIKQVFFASVADMKAYTGTNDIAAVTQGYYTANDGGAANYYWSGTSTATDDAFLVHRPNNIAAASPGRWLLQFGNYVNLMWAGAKPDGTTDARAAFKKCITAVTTISQGPLSLNGTIEIPRGTFRMSDSVTFRNVVNIIGKGSGVYPNMESILLFDNISRGLYFYEASSGRSGKGCIIKNLFIRCVGTDWHSDRHGIFSNTQIYAENVAVYNFSGDGFHINTQDSGNANNAMLVNCHADYNRRYGFSTWGNDANNIHFQACDANTNGGSNFHDQSFLGDQYYGLHSSYAGIREPNNLSYVNVGGVIYGCIRANSAIQPGVTSGWQDYWIQQDNLPLGWTTTWSADSSYFDACAFTSTGVTAATNVYGGYTEGGQAPARLVGSAMWWGGDVGSGFTTNRSILLGNQSMLGGEVRVTNKFEPLAYAALDESFGLNIGLSDIGTGTSGLLEMRGYGADTIMRIFANSVPTPTVFFPLKDFKAHSDYGRDSVKPGSMVINSALSGLYFTDLNDPNYDAGKKRALFMGSSSPTTGTEKEFAAGDIILNNNAGTDTIGWKCTVRGRPGTWVAWVLGSGGGGGGGGGTAYGSTGNMQFKGVLGDFRASTNLSYDSATSKLTVQAAGLDDGILLQANGSSNYSPKIKFNTTTFNIPASIWADYNGDLLIKTEFGQFTKFGTSNTGYNVSINSYTTGSLSSPDNYSLLTRSASAATIALIARGTTSQTSSVQEWQDVSNNPMAAVSAGGSFDLYNATAPSSSVTNGIRLYAQDVAASSELKVRDEAGNITTLSPHNTMGLPYKLKPLGWTYHSEKNGQFITVDQLKLAEEVERLTKEVEELKALLLKNYKAKKGTKLIYKGKVK